MSLTVNKTRLDELYAEYNRFEYVHPDPLEFLHNYDDPRDREIVGLVASSLAYGRVAQILKSVSAVLERMPSPSAFLKSASRISIEKAVSGFKHRFTTGADMVSMLYGAKHAIEAHGSLHACFVRHLNRDDDTVLPALTGFVDELVSTTRPRTRPLLPSPRRGSTWRRSDCTGRSQSTSWPASGYRTSTTW